MSSSVAEPRQTDAGWIIVGNGRIGNALINMGSGKDILIRRNENVPSALLHQGEGKNEESKRDFLPLGPPVVIATRNDDLESVIDALPLDRKNDLVLIQNGMLDPFLKQKSLIPGDNCTQVLIYFAVSKKGDTPIDGNVQGPVGCNSHVPSNTNLDFGSITPKTRGLTAACGPHAVTFARRLWANGLTCRILDSKSFRQAMLEKLVWISAYMLIGVTKGGIRIGDIVRDHRQEVDDLASELILAGAEAIDVDLKSSDGLQYKGNEKEVMHEILERLAEYSNCVSEYPTALKEVSWRNGFFMNLSEAAEKVGKSDPCPIHSTLIKKALR
eukprot:CAMPEP_0175042210 /NCGR_PEP_ID=MMETSP0052_2-20121109/2418_1 /TAXON_ID=51329 ORGANISM="Polytomella parva, Strain SAG 63-3" /NCGR_SAMPLE_ID=MMETSP0052_2 /ASSEMBLY_ACC=CAM_ASM_000194 /LENGTH=327 /DNA_ID=CAMNT_0016304959 /DNA_START=144 /DNA_END=1127 /DNA_ORIENTATION=-